MIIRPYECNYTTTEVQEAAHFMPELKRRSEIPETLRNVFFYTLTYKVKNGTVSVSA